MKVSYIFKRLLHMNYGQMLSKINSIHKKTGMGRIKIFMDMKECAVKYGAGYMDYDLFEMYNLTDEQRDTYITRGRNNELVKKYNDLAYAHFFDNKDEFCENFDKFLKRKWLRVVPENRDAIRSFLEENPVFIAKPTDGSCGKGVDKLDVASFGSVDKCLEHIYSYKEPYLVEQVIRQHPDVSAVYAQSVNTVRAVTVYRNGKVHFVLACCRIGNGGKHVDNFNNGGMTAPVDENTGEVLAPAIDKKKNLYKEHPMTGTPIVGFHFPDWDQVIELITEAALVIPQVGYVGWDVAFTPEGPCLVEGNNFTGHDLYQLPEHTPNKIGVMPKFPD